MMQNVVQVTSQVVAFIKDFYKLALFAVFNAILPGNLHCHIWKGSLYYTEMFQALIWEVTCLPALVCTLRAMSTGPPLHSC